MDNVPTDLLLSSPEEAAEKLACYKLISQRSGGLVKDAGLAEWWKATTDSTGDWLKSTTDSAGDWWKTTASPVVSDYWSKYKNALSGGAGQGAQLATLAGTGAAGFGLLGLIREAAREKKRRNLMNAFYPAIMGGLAGLGGGVAWQNLPQLRKGVQDLINPPPPPPAGGDSGVSVESIPVLNTPARVIAAGEEGGVLNAIDAAVDPGNLTMGNTEDPVPLGRSTAAGGAISVTPSVLRTIRHRSLEDWNKAIAALGLKPAQANKLRQFMRAEAGRPILTTGEGRQALRHGLVWNPTAEAGTGAWELPAKTDIRDSLPGKARTRRPGRWSITDRLGALWNTRPGPGIGRSRAQIGDAAARAGLPTPSSGGRGRSRVPVTGEVIKPGDLRTVRQTALKPPGIARKLGRGIWSLPLLFGLYHDYKRLGRKK